MTRNKPRNNKGSVSRREFIGAMGAVGAYGLAGVPDAAAPFPTSDWKAPPLLDEAPGGQPLKTGLVGCGGRGTGAAFDHLSAGEKIEITALGDVFQERLDSCRKRLKDEKGNAVDESRCFLGFDAFQKVIDSGVDVVILATPPHFRPEHFAACVRARKHVFMEKPVAVDPVGARSLLASARKAARIGISVVTGTQRRHQHDYIETWKKIADGDIGDIVSANCYWNQNKLWHRNRKDEWSDMEYMIRDWVNWCWLSGDHIVEQHVHNIDTINWFTGLHPVKAVGFGGRHRRLTGDQYDFFSVDFEYENGIHVHSMCRQIDGCVTNVSERIQGTKGWSNCRNTIWKPDGSVAWKAQNPPRSAYQQEHIDLVTAIRRNEPIMEADGTAISTLAAVMGRISAYTGKEVGFEEMMSSPIRIGPEKYAMGPVDMEAASPVPGQSPT